VYVQNDGDATTLDHHHSTTSVLRFHTAKTRQRTVLTSIAWTGKIHTIHTPQPMTAICKHPIVKVVAREDDIEFVECQQCGEVFDSAEYVDIAIEEEDALADHLPED
jgi:hypothetical protein